MSKYTTINRREVLRMLSSSFMGSAILGPTIYVSTDLYQREIAKADVAEALKDNPGSPSTAEELMKLTEKERQDLTHGYTKVATALGALIGSEHYEWEMPDPFTVEPN